MIPGVGAIIRVVKGVRERGRMQERIERLNSLCTSPATDFYNGAERFWVSQKLEDAKLAEFLSKDPSREEWRNRLNEYFTKLEKEYSMAEQELSKQFATKAELCALGMAIKEIALTYDEALEDFRAKLEKEEAKFNLAIEKANALLTDTQKTCKITLETCRESTTTVIEQTKKECHQLALKTAENAAAFMREAEAALARHLNDSSAKLTAHLAQSEKQATVFRKEAEESLNRHLNESATKLAAHISASETHATAFRTEVAESLARHLNESSAKLDAHISASEKRMTESEQRLTTLLNTSGARMEQLKRMQIAVIVVTVLAVAIILLAK